MIHFLADILVFLLPFERIPSLEVAGLTVRVSSFIILAFIVFGLPYLLVKRGILPVSALDRILSLYYITVLLSIPLSVAFNRSLVTAAIIGFVGCGYLLVSRAYRQAFDFDRISSIIILSAVLTAVFGVFQYFGDAMGLPQTMTGLLDRYTSYIFGFARIQSVGLEPLYYANYLLLPMFLLITRMMLRPFNWGDAGAWFLLFWVFVLTLSRGAYLGFAAGFFVIMLILWRKKAINWRKIAQFAAVTIIVLFVAYMSVQVVAGRRGLESFGSHALISRDTQEASATPRIERFQEAVYLFRQHPLSGVGIGAFGEASRFPIQPEGGYEIVNNQYLETLAETGLIGFITLVGVGVTVMTLLLQRLKAETSILPVTVLLATFIGFLTQYNFFSTIYIIHIWVFLGLVDSYLYFRKS